MSNFLFYFPDLSAREITLHEEESKHLIKVLRKTQGDLVQLVDGKGNLATASISKDHPKHCELLITSIQHKENPRPYQFSLAIAPTKNSDRIEWMLEKCVEIGLDELFLLETQNSERSKFNMDRLEKIAISAMKQSKQFYLPRIHAIQKFDSFLKQQAHWNCARFIAWVEAEKTSSLIKRLQANTKECTDILVLIGPEGDFAKQEVDQALKMGFDSVSLGQSILRTETAAIQSASWISGFFETKIIPKN